MIGEHLGLSFRIGFIFYVALAMIYTAVHFWLVLFGPSDISSPVDLLQSRVSAQDAGFNPFRLMDNNYFVSNMSARQVEDFLLSPSFSSLSSPDSITSEETFLSRAFPRLMQPMKIIPFYYKSTGNFDKDDITITTLITSDRFPVFKQLVERYQGDSGILLRNLNTTLKKEN
jgi:hypothetical protein